MSKVLPGHGDRDIVAYRCEEVERGMELGFAYTPMEGKKPTLKGWQRAPHPMPDQVRHWATQGNVGIRTGSVSGIVVIDVDEGADESGLDLPPTPTVKTGKGRHLYYRVPKDADIGNSCAKIAAHVDVRGERGVVVAPGSVHPGNGAVYQWMPGLSPGDIDFAAFPEAFVERLKVTTRGPQTRQQASNATNLVEYVRAAVKDEVNRVKSVPEGQRNDQLYKSAFTLGTLLAASSFDEAIVRRELLDAAQECGLGEDEARRTIESGLKSGKERPRMVSPADCSPSRQEGAIPLYPDPLPCTPFPIDELGPILGPMAQALQRVVQAPDGICAQATLSAACLAVQPYRDVVVDGRTIPLSDFFVTVAESGERKTACDKIVLEPHREFERELHANYLEQEHPRYQREREAYEVAKQQVLKKFKGNDWHELEKALGDLGPEPEAPVIPILITDDPTIEGVQKHLMRGWPSIGVYSDEAGKIVGGHAFNEDNLLKSLCGFSSFWDGTQVTRLRAGDGAAMLYGRRLSMHLMLQPVVAAKLIDSRMAQGQGFLSRCLRLWPETKRGQRPYREEDLAHCREMTNYKDRIRNILNHPLPLDNGAQNILKPAPIALTRLAKKLWIEYHDHVEKSLAPGQQLEPIRDFACKAADHALRLAGILTCIEEIEAEGITEEAIQAAICLTDYYLNEALRIIDISRIDEKTTLASKLLGFFRSRPNETLTVRDICRNGPNPLRKKKLADEALRRLAEHGYIEALPGGVSWRLL